MKLYFWSLIFFFFFFPSNKSFRLNCNWGQTEGTCALIARVEVLVMVQGAGGFSVGGQVPTPQACGTWKLLHSTGQNTQTGLNGCRGPGVWAILEDLLPRDKSGRENTEKQVSAIRTSAQSHFHHSCKA